MKRLICILLAIGLSASTFAAGPASPADKWGRITDYEKALQLAKKTDSPIVILFQFENSTCPLHNGMVASTMFSSSLDGMVRLRAFTTDDSPILRQASRTVEGSNGMIPEIYFLSPAGELIAFVDYKDQQQTTKVAGLVSEVTKWQAKARKQLETVDEAAAQGRYTAALRTLSEIETADSKATTAMKPLLPLKPQGQSKETSFSTASESKGNEKDKPAAKAPVVKTDSKPKTPEPGVYFAAAVAEKRAACKTSSEERLAKGKKFAEAKNFSEARKILTPMVNDNSNLPAVSQAAALLKQIQDDEAAAKKAATPAVSKSPG